MSKTRTVYDIVTQKELTAEKILELIAENMKKQNWKLVAHYLQLFIKSVGHLLV